MLLTSKCYLKEHFDIIPKLSTLIRTTPLSRRQMHEFNTSAYFLILRKLGLAFKRIHTQYSRHSCKLYTDRSEETLCD